MDRSPQRRQSDKSSSIQLLERTFSVLSSFSVERPSLSLDELSELLGINKPSLLRIVRALEQENFLIREGYHYHLGPRVLELSNVYLETLSVNHIAKPFMEELASRYRLTASLAIREGIEVVYIAIEQARHELGIQGEIGGRHPANATALGKVFLADLSEAALHELLEDQELPKLTERTLTDPDALQKHLQKVRDNGYAIDDQERGKGIRCVATPIRDYSGQVVAAFSLAGSVFHLTEETQWSVLEGLLEVSEEISKRMGYTGAVHKQPVSQR